MTKIIFFKRDGLYTGYEISGHSGYAEAGKDIVCSAISVLTINTANALDEINKEVLEVSSDEDKGYLSVRLKSFKEESSQVLIKALELGLLGIQNEYGSKYCKVDYKEEDANVKA